MILRINTQDERFKLGDKMFIFAIITLWTFAVGICILDKTFQKSSITFLALFLRLLNSWPNIDGIVPFREVMTKENISIYR